MVPNTLTLQAIQAALRIDGTLGNVPWAVGLMQAPFNEGDDLNDPVFTGAEPIGGSYAQIASPNMDNLYYSDPVTGDSVVKLATPIGGFFWTNIGPTFPITLYGAFAYVGAPGDSSPGDGSGALYIMEVFPTPILIQGVTDFVALLDVTYAFGNGSFR